MESLHIAVLLAVIVVAVVAVVAVVSLKRAGERYIEKTGPNPDGYPEKPAELMGAVMASTSPTIPGRSATECLGMVRGFNLETPRSHKGVVLGERQALSQMLKAAQDRGADAVVSVQLVVGGYAFADGWRDTVVVYTGTAVKLAPEEMA